MKLMQIAYHFEYAEIIENILDRHGVQHFVRYPMIDGRDCDGKHFGTQVHPGNASVVQALVNPQQLDAIFADLTAFRERKESHRHLEAFIIPVERRL